MSRFIKCLCLPALALGLLAVADASSADAANGPVMRHGMHHGGGIGAGPGHAPHPTMRRTIRRAYPIYGGYRHRLGHRFPHHYPWRIVPHNGHFDIVPGYWGYHWH